MRKRDRERGGGRGKKKLENFEKKKKKREVYIKKKSNFFHLQVVNIQRRTILSIGSVGQNGVG